jgi:alpha-1,3-glucan synthase
MEDFHKRSINASRHLASHDAWRQSDGASGGITAIAEHDDWNPVHQAVPPQPDWDVQSIHNSPRFNIPGSPGQWSQETLTPGGDPFLHAPPRIQDGSRNSISSNMSDTEGDSFLHNRGGNGRGEFGNFLDKANRTIARDQKHAPDPFLEAPSRPFGDHSRVSSVESIASIVDEKANSPLNKAIASVSQIYLSPYRTNLQCLQFTDSDGGVAQEFITKLQNLSADNSKGELSIEKFLQKSEEAFFDKVRKDKLSSAASSLRSSRRESMWGTPSLSLYDHPSRPTCMFIYICRSELSTDWTQLPTPTPSILQAGTATSRVRWPMTKGKLSSCQVFRSRCPERSQAGPCTPSSLPSGKSLVPLVSRSHYSQGRVPKIICNFMFLVASFLPRPQCGTRCSV